MQEQTLKVNSQLLVPFKSAEEQTDRFGAISTREPFGRVGG